MDDGSVSKKRQIVATLAVLILIVVIVGALTLGKKDSQADSTAQTTTSDTARTTETDTPAAQDGTRSDFKDGTYTATGGYNSPGGAEKITVSVTLKDGKVTDTSAKSGATSAEAELHQKDFIGAFKDFVLGKDISDVRLSRVAGSSLTSQGFNNAITQIKTQAKS